MGTGNVRHRVSRCCFPWLLRVNRKGEAALSYATNAYRGTRWRWLVNSTPRPLYPLKEAEAPIVKEAGWSPEPVWTFWGREDYLVPAGTRTSGSSSPFPSSFTNYPNPGPYFMSIPALNMNRSRMCGVVVHVLRPGRDYFSCQCHSISNPSRAACLLNMKPVVCP